MAQSNNGDLFSFVIEPEFDTGNIKDHARMLEKELKKIAERISTEIAEEKQIVVKKIYPCKVNAAVPFNHRMLR